MIPSSEDVEYRRFWTRAILVLSANGRFKPNSETESVFKRIVEITEEGGDSSDRSSDYFTGEFIKEYSKDFVKSNEDRLGVGRLLHTLGVCTKNKLQDFIDGYRQDFLFEIVRTSSIPANGEHGLEWKIANPDEVEQVAQGGEGVEAIFEWIILDIAPGNDDFESSILLSFASHRMSKPDESGAQDSEEERKAEREELAEFIEALLLDSEGKFVETKHIGDQWSSSDGGIQFGKSKMIARSSGFKTLGDFIERDVRNNVENKGNSLTRRFEGTVKQRFGININDSIVDLEVTRQREEPLRVMILNWFHGERKVPDDADLAARIIVSIVEQSRLMADELGSYMVTSTDKMVRRDLHNELVKRVARDFPKTKIHLGDL